MKWYQEVLKVLFIVKVIINNLVFTLRDIDLLNQN